jgi:hypothetical protein
MKAAYFIAFLSLYTDLPLRKPGLQANPAQQPPREHALSLAVRTAAMRLRAHLRQLALVLPIRLDLMGQRDHHLGVHTRPPRGLEID